MAKKLFTVLLVCMAALSLFAAGEKEAAGDTNILVMSEWSGDSTLVKTFRARLDEITAADNGIKIEQEMIGDETSYYNKLRTRMATGEYPDVFFDYGGSRSKEFVDSGILVDLKPYLDADPEWRDGFLGGSMNEWIYDDYPNSVYGVPTGFFCVGMYYNKSILDEAGVEKVPETFAEFEDACDKILAAGYIPMSLGEKDNYRAGHLFNNLVIRTYGDQFAYDLGTRDVAYDSPEAIAIYKMIYDWNNKGYFGPNAINKDAAMEKADFHNRKCAFHMDGTWYLNAEVPELVADDIYFAPMPYGDEAYKGVWFGGSNGGLSIINTGDEKKVEKALEVVKDLTSMEFTAIQQKTVGGGFYPVKLPADAKAESRIAQAVADVTAESVDTFVNDIQNYDINTKMLDTVRAALQGLFVGKTPEECAAEIMLVVDAE